MARAALQMQEIGFGRRLALARKLRGWTQPGLAEAIDRGTDTLSAWENAETTGRYPPADVLGNICATLDVSADWLLFGDSATPP
jgi:transcriptional regulator with XRE-family HTH domain